MSNLLLEWCMSIVKCKHLVIDTLLVGWLVGCINNKCYFLKAETTEFFFSKLLSADLMQSLQS